ncbi:MAG: hypothetical protein M5U28_40945 [Sandaracinaceae bacterium]|nr:hypothetical protein [Sandaracinaceae bacterium]
MIRTEHARRAGFDAALRRSQDSDMLIRALLGRHYALIPDVLYAYSQGSAATLEKTLEGYRYRIRAHLKHLAVHPVRVTRTVGETLAKMAIFRVAGELGFHHHLIARRWGATDAETTAGFCDALRAVQRARCEFFA